MVILINRHNCLPPEGEKSKAPEQDFTATFKNLFFYLYVLFNNFYEGRRQIYFRIPDIPQNHLLVRIVFADSKLVHF